MKKPKPDLTHISPDLRPLAVPLADLTPDPENARSHPEPNLTTLKALLTRYGQRKPLVVNRRTGRIEAGNGLFLAAHALGWEYVAVSHEDDEPAAAAGYALGDNRSAELSAWNVDMLPLQVELAALEVPDLAELGFLPGDLDAILSPEEPGKDRGPESQSMAKPIKVTAEQRETIDQAIAEVRGEAGDESLSEGRCIELVCADFLAGR